MAAVALDHRLNANLLRRWVVTAERTQERRRSRRRRARSERDAGKRGICSGRRCSSLAAVTSPEIVIELRRGATMVKVSWPLAAAASCAAWLRELLR